MILLNYWYLSLNNSYPKGSRRVMSVAIHRSYTIVEMTSEASPSDLNKHKFIYIGRGFFDDKHIQENLTKYAGKIQKGIIERYGRELVGEENETIILPVKRMETNEGICFKKR